MASASTSSAASHGQGLHETTSSRCVTDTFTGTHNFEVRDFSLLDGMGVDEFVASSTFTVGGYDWDILLYPDGDYRVCQGAYVSVFLRCRGGESTSSVRARYSLSMVDIDGRVSKLPILRDYMTYMRIFHPEGPRDRGWGCPYFIQKYNLRHFLYLNDDSLTIRCTLTLFKSRTEDAINTAISVLPPNLHQDLEHMLKDRKGVDVTFNVDGQLFQAHRCVLSARSPVFDAELFGPLKKNREHTIKTIDDMDPNIFEGLLHFIYTDSLPEDNCNSDENTTMQHLLVAADQYGLERLRVMCEAKLCRGIDVQTVATSLALAEQHNCVQLREACIRFIASRDVLSAIMETDGFKHLQGSCPLITKEILDEVAAYRRRRTSLQQLWSCRKDEFD